MANSSSEDGTPEENEYLVANNSTEDDIDADHLDSDEASSTDEDSSADNTLDHTTEPKVSKRSRRLLDDIENLYQGILGADAATKKFKREAEDQAREAKRLKMKSESDLKKMHRRCDGLEKKREALESGNTALRREVRRTADRDLINKANEDLRLDLEETKVELSEKEAELRKELDEKADYHHIKKERTDFHRKLISKTNVCRHLEEQNAELQSELIDMTDSCTGLEKKVAELQRKLDEEVSFSAQAMAMFSKEPEY